MVDIRPAESVKDLQHLVLEKWKAARGMSTDRLIMEFSLNEGRWLPVTRSSSLKDIKMARSLRLFQRKQRSRNAPSTSGQFYDVVEQGSDCESKIE